ncbi:MAG: methyltransferase domain-containing protein [Rhodobacteraceae bacterium]|nr:methyltransferase domain-containing protein [Paracoccaceae bacterium]
MTSDHKTLSFYDTEAQKYAKWSEPSKPDARIQRMIARLPKAGHLLDFGCGAGWASKAFYDAGFIVTALDASKGLIDQLSQHSSITTRLASFDMLDDDRAFDGVWASFSLQHAPRGQMPNILRRVFNALKPNGVLYIGVQKGPETIRDSLGRLYAHYQIDEMTALLKTAGFQHIQITVGSGKNYDGTPTENLNIEAEKPA